MKIRQLFLTLGATYNSIQKALAVYLGLPPQRFDPKRFLPSTRSIAFKKSLWRKWEVPKKLWVAIKKFYVYAREMFKQVYGGIHHREYQLGFLFYILWRSGR